MLHEVFYWAFNMSITATAAGVIVLLLRRIKKIPKQITVCLWWIPFLRMVIPIGYNSPYSLMSVLHRITTKTVIVYQPKEEVAFSMLNSVRAADTYFPITYKINRLQTVFTVGAVIWLVGALAFLLLLLILYVALLREAKGAMEKQDGIYFSDTAKTPAVYGIIKPKIILPSFYREKDTTFIVLHEKIHIKRLDNLWRMLALMITSVHWFNPMCPLFLKCFFSDLEQACDACVLSKVGEGKKKEYAKALLMCKENEKKMICGFGGAKMRTRIENILSFKKMTWFSCTAFLMWMSVVFYVLLTNAR